MTLTSSPVTLAESETIYDFAFSPESAASFTQLPGEVVTVTMAASFDAPNPGLLFCDLHAAVNLPNGSAVGSGGDYFAALRQDWLAQRGDVWWEMTDEGSDLTRTIPAPAAAIDHTLIGVAWMAAIPVDEGEPDPDCYGTKYGYEPQEVKASVRVSVVKVKN